MHLAFVHTPMATMPVAQRRTFWQNFDVRYHAAHPGLRHMKNNLWELPHWMHWLGGVLVEAGYTSLEAIDFYTSECTIDGIDRLRVSGVLLEHPADVYLFSPMTPNLPFAFEIAEVIKDLYPAAVVIFGGIVATPLKLQVAQNPNVDYVVHDRGEYALPALLKEIEAKRVPESVGNLAYRDAYGSVRTSETMYPYMPVNDIPPPKIDLFSPEVGGDIRYLRQVYALGCPYKCGFCTIQTIGRKADYFDIDRVINEIGTYRDYYGSHHNVYFGDETFTVHKGRTLEICDALKADGTIKYDCQTRLNCLGDHQVLDALRESGCKWVEIGIETLNQDSSDLFKQKLQLSQTREALRRVRDAGLPACSFMVNGFPNQTLDDMKRSLEMACELIDDQLLQASYLFGLVPYPGSTMYEEPERFGMTLLHRNYKLYHEDMPPVFSSPYAQPDQVYEVFLEGVASLGQAMGRPSYFGSAPAPVELDSFGTFWSDPHV